LIVGVGVCPWQETWQNISKDGEGQVNKREK